jgi:MoaA/NifB/PqqE/SkfB family radical SAM enzyme
MIKVNKNMKVENPYTFEGLYSMEYKMCWHMNDLCNLRCEYCFFDYFTKENPLVGRLNPQEIYEAFKKTGKNWHLFLSGGEPMLYPRFNELINLLQQDHGIQISTNLFNKNVKSFAEEVYPVNINVINAALHIDTKTDTTLKKFIDNYHLLESKGFPMMVSYVTYPPLFNRIKQDFDLLKKEGITKVHALTFQGEYEGKMYPGSYTKEQIEIIKELSLDQNELFLTNNKMNFKGKMCHAGMKYFYMEIDGEVYQCVTVRKSSGNLFDGTFKPNEKPVCCPASHCQDSWMGRSSLLEKLDFDEDGKDQNIFMRKIEKIKNAYFKI